MKVNMDSEHNRTVAEWRHEDVKRGWQTNMHYHARKHGVAGVLLANGNFRLLYRHTLQGAHWIRQKTWKAVSI